MASELFENIWEVKDVFETCSMVVTTNYTILERPCVEILNVTRFSKTLYTCFTIEATPKTVYDYAALQRIKGNNGFMFEVNFHKNVSAYTDDLFLYLHQFGSYPRHGFTRSMYLNDLTKTQYITFQEFQSKLLKAPFESNCRDYETTGYGNRGGCVSTCTQMEALQRFGAIPPGYAFFPGQSDKEKLMSTHTLITDPDLFKILQDIQTACSAACPQPNCFQT